MIEMHVKPKGPWHLQTLTINLPAIGTCKIPSQKIAKSGFPSYFLRVRCNNGHFADQRAAEATKGTSSIFGYPGNGEQ